MWRSTRFVGALARGAHGFDFSDDLIHVGRFAARLSGALCAGNQRLARAAAHGFFQHLLNAFRCEESGRLRFTRQAHGKIEFDLHGVHLGTLGADALLEFFALDEGIEQLGDLSFGFGVELLDALQASMQLRIRLLALLNRFNPQ
jgi:hypothetical protein